MIKTFIPLDFKCVKSKYEFQNTFNWAETIQSVPLLPKHSFSDRNRPLSACSKPVFSYMAVVWGLFFTCCIVSDNTWSTNSQLAVTNSGSFKFVGGHFFVDLYGWKIHRNTYTCMKKFHNLLDMLIDKWGVAIKFMINI